MNPQVILNDIKTLPPDKQEEVADFIAFLKTQSEIRKGGTSDSSSPAKSDNFFGMWADRQDMQDSSQWVRELRASEW